MLIIMPAKGSGAPKIAKTCRGCGEQFTVPPWLPREFCNRACYRSLPKQSIEEARAKRRVWKAANPDKIKAERNSPQAKERHKKWREQNPDKVRLYRKKNEETHRESYKAGREKYRKSERGQNVYRQWAPVFIATPKNRMARLVASAKRRAKLSSLEFDPKIRDKFTHDPPRQCLCCGDDFDFTAFNGRSHRSPSLDRRDSTKGYTVDNTEAICWGCNSLKSDATVSDIENLLGYMRRAPSTMELVA